MEFSSSFSIIIFFLFNRSRREKAEKSAFAREGENYKVESEEKRGCVSSPLELTVEGEKGRERKGERDWESESG